MARAARGPPSKAPPMPSTRAGEQASAAIEFVILAGVDDVEAAVQQVTAAVSQRMRGIERAAHRDPRGSRRDSQRLKPSTRCEKDVNRLVKE